METFRALYLISFQSFYDMVKGTGRVDSGFTGHDLMKDNWGCMALH
jgi:hypothetical protein